MMGSFFKLTDKELKGNLLILAIAFLFIGVRYVIFPLFLPEPKLNRADKGLIDRYLSNIEKVEEQETEIPNFFRFDPNNISVDSLMMLGLSQTVAERFIKYKKVIGGFKELYQVEKVYGLPISLKENLDSLVVFRKTTLVVGKTMDSNILESQSYFSKERQVKRKKAYYPKKSEYEKREKKPVVEIFELNDASPEQLQSVYGIGSVLSKRIVKYQTVLGGFASYDQLYKVYGLDSLTVLKLKEVTTIDTTKIISLPINSITVKELARHPYISWKQAQVLANYRLHHDEIKNLKDLQKSKAFDDKEMEQLKAYISFD